MKFISLISLLWSLSIYSQTPITLDQVKEIILQNTENLSSYKEGSVFKSISTGYQETENGKICRFESTELYTILLVPNDEDEIPTEIFILMESSQKPTTVDTCGDLITPGTFKLVYLISPPIPTLKWLKNLDKEEDKYYQSEDGQIFSELDGERCFYNFKMPLMFMETRCEFKEGIDTNTQLPGANLEIIYNEIKDLPVYFSYPSGPNTTTGGVELGKKFGEILEDWKNSSNQ